MMMLHHHLRSWALLCACLLVVPSWSGTNKANAKSNGAFVRKRSLEENSLNSTFTNRLNNNNCLTSPNYPNNYPNSVNKRQTISVPAGKSIEIIFEDFDVEYGTSRCPYDYLEFKDGNGKLVGKKLCGDSLPRNIIIPTSTALVLFHTDGSVTEKGYKFCYNSCMQWASPDYPNDYPNRHDSTQTLAVPTGKSIEISFADFDVEYGRSTCPYDYLEFKDENDNVVGKKLCGNALPEKITIPTSTASALFHTDGSVTKKGFNFCYKEAGKEKCSTVCEHSWLNMNCLPNERIDIKSSLYGRSDTSTCLPCGRCDTSCSASIATDKVKALCNGMQSCSVKASNSVFGDPCYGTVKYLKICYECTNKSKCKCGVKKEARIVGGAQTTINEYPWMAALSMGCGGSLIADRWVLTAAHCFYRNGVQAITDPSTITITLGEHDKSVTTETTLTIKVTPDQIIIHESYNDELSLNDLALVRLPSPVDINVYTPVCLPPQGEDYTGKKAWIYGWGALSENGPQSKTLQELEITILPDKAGKDKFQLTDAQLDVMVFAGGVKGKDACQGDSGGPLSYDNNGQHHLVGATSWGYGCAREGFPGAYAQVSNFRSWIDLKMDQNGGKNTCY